ncbi:PhoH family protein [Rhodohalobacter sp. SW132]|uniref:PhoH family protein n=1 Tax=Rhodohalobacter sp. SW132 TaxID=2293433 RepID=UPI000E24C497|nr:PhoH family protein [Rhodohalobacter sp. SW132]REL24838.1 PhoH family protein [Rhodohalobacter sp. SW132]
MPKTKKAKKIFVLDTSVLLYDSNAVKNFEKHDVAIPITVLEELDSFKKGNSVTNLHAREFIRYLDGISDSNMMKKWIPLNGKTHGNIRVVNDEDSKTDANRVFGSVKNDHRILNSALKLRESEKSKKVVLVSKDINLRLKARALSLDAEDYETIRIKDIDHLYRGKTDLEFNDNGLINELYKEGQLDPKKLEPSPPVSNHFYILKNHSSSALGYFNPGSEKVELVNRVNAYGISPRNAEQTFALHAIMNPEIQLVSITGSAGTGKTLLALAGALEQRSLYRQIFLARPIVPLSNRDIGYLPGDAQSKIDPYMQPLWDNLNIIKNQYKESSKAYQKLDEMVQTDKLSIVPLAYIRGRSLSNVIFIVDEAQNLTPHEIKTIITRAGENTKIIFTGDIFQIDTPYLDAQSNGLSYLVDRLNNNKIYAHINLEKGERSELANLASKFL